MMKIGVFCHMFYSELFIPLKAQLENIPEPSDLYLSTCSESDRALLIDMFTGWNGRVMVRVVKNKGRDIAPFLVTFANELPSYTYGLHIHTKGSIPEWRDHILQHLLGSESIVDDIIARFENDSQLGIIAAPHYPPIRDWIHWGPNKQNADALAKRMQIEPETLFPLDFPSGSMFWFRPRALQPWLDINLTLDDFPEETGQLDGTIAHAIERLFYFAARKVGFSWTTVPLHPPRESPMDNKPAKDYTLKPEDLEPIADSRKLQKEYAAFRRSISLRSSFVGSATPSRPQ
jgi:lipopolysaccharide biosynthesis protein